jgi:hypothetical protein
MIAYSCLLATACYFSWRGGERIGVHKGINYTLNSLEANNLIHIDEDDERGIGLISSTAEGNKITIG